MNRALLESVRTILLRDLDKMESELNLYPTDEAVWKTAGAITNPAGNLCLHLCGNLQHYIGAVLGKSGYKRNRDSEFSLKGLPRTELIKEISATKMAVSDTLDALRPSDIEAQYPENVFGHPMTTLHFLIHLSAHFGYHLGQVNYHRRLVAL